MIIPPQFLQYLSPGAFSYPQSQTVLNNFPQLLQ